MSPVATGDMSSVAAGDMCQHMCWHMCGQFEESKRKRPHPDFAKKSTFRNGKWKNEFLVLQLGLKSTQVYIVRSCAEDARGLLCKISGRTGDRVRNPNSGVLGNLTKNGRQGTTLTIY